jgi:hypothetical protein
MAPKDDTNLSSGMERDSLEKPISNVQEVNPAAVGLAAVTAEHKPRPFSPAMVRLYGIMAIGYLVSTINGYGKPA